jgi:hypothetical protein
LEVTTEDGRTEVILARDAKGTRAGQVIKLNELIQNANNCFDSDVVKMGYAYGMKFDHVKGRQIKVPKKEHEIRTLFNVTDPKKASFWSHDWDKIDMNALDTEKKRLSFIRGLFSAKARIRPGSKGSITFNWEGLTDHDELLNIVDKIDITATIEFNCCTMFFINKHQIMEYIKRIGFIQDSKMQDAMTLYRLHQRIVNDVIPVGADYLLYHVQNFGDPSDYTADLLRHFDINARDKKTARTPLINAIKSIKHKSMYPAIWLLKNGADMSLKSKKGETFESVFIEFNENYRFVSRHKELAHLDDFYLTVLDRYSVDSSEYTKKFVDLIAYGPSFKCLLAMVDKGCLDKVDNGIIVSEILKRKYIREFDKIGTLLSKIIEKSSENLSMVMNDLLDELRDLVISLPREVRILCNYDVRYYQILFSILKEYVNPPTDKIAVIEQMLREKNISTSRTGDSFSLSLYSANNL